MELFIFLLFLVFVLLKQNKLYFARSFFLVFLLIIVVFIIF